MIITMISNKMPLIIFTLNQIRIFFNIFLFLEKDFCCSFFVFCVWFFWFCFLFLKTKICITHTPFKGYTKDNCYCFYYGYDHNNSKLYKDVESLRNEILATDVEIGNALGLENYCSHVFRFPNGFMSKNYSGSKKSAVSILKDLNYVYVDWNCLNQDFL